jgi:mannose-1-phosphate guanylyltransferase/mannose-6-phosphate isomerase
MIAVIIAGGSGTRLWPLSTPEYPKHLLVINGDESSLVQKTYKRAKRIASEIYVLTEASHAHHVKDQLPELADENFIIEPARRGTASCIVAALEYIGKKHDPKEPIAFLAADHYIRDLEGFAQSFKVAGDVSEDTERIVLVGVEPDYPATGFGYIQKDGLFNQNSFVYNVHSFKEKPDYETAKQYMSSGKYLWNCGYFVGSVEAFKKAMKNYAPSLLKNLEDLSGAGDNYKETYLKFENNSIDYALIEHVKDLLVVPASFDWMDLGSFGDLHKAAGADETGNHTHGDVELEGVENSYVQNHGDKPVAVIGMDNVVVINTKAGILVARKDLSQKVGDVSKRINARGQ